MIQSSRPIRFRRALQHGFTLLEILVVLVIIGLLAGLVGPRLLSQVDRGKVTTAEAQIKMLKSALETPALAQLLTVLAAAGWKAAGLPIIVLDPRTGEVDIEVLVEPRPLIDSITFRDQAGLVELADDVERGLRGHAQVVQAALVGELARQLGLPWVEAKLLEKAPPPAEGAGAASAPSPWRANIDEGAFHEAVTNRILDDLVRATRPRYMRLTAKFNVRGGIGPAVVAEHRKRGWRPA